MNAANTIEIVLESLRGPELPKKLFWEILEYEPEDLLISESLISPSAMPWVSEARIFGAKPDHVLIRIKISTDVELRRSRLAPILNSFLKSFPFSLFLISDSKEQQFAIAHIDRVGKKHMLLLPLWIPKYHRIIAELLSELSPDENLKSTAGTLQEVDIMMASQDVVNLAKHMEVAMSQQPVGKNLAWWIRQASKHKLFTGNQERLAFERLEELWPREERFGEVPQKAKECLDEIVLANLRFVIFTTFKYYSPKTDDDRLDLIQLGNIGLVEAAKRFHIERGFKFISYATWYVKSYIMNYLNSEALTIRIPLNQMQTRRKYDISLRTLSNRLGFEPYCEQIGADLGLSNQDAQLTATLPLTQISLGHLLPSQVPTVDHQQYNVETRDQQLTIQTAFAMLDQQEKDVLIFRFGIAREKGMSLEEIGKLYRVSRERARQLEKGAIDRLRVPVNRNKLAWMMGYRSEKPLYG